MAEGEKTEVSYLKGLINNRKSLGVNPLIELVLLEREGEIQHDSAPKRLKEILDSYIEKISLEDFALDKERDEFILIFDRDSYDTEKEYPEFLRNQSEVFCSSNKPLV